MSSELILGAVGTVLGVFNFFYWAWWAKRDKVTIVLHDCFANFVPRGKEETAFPGKAKNHSLHIYISCALVLTSGEKEIEAMGVGIRLHKETCEELKKYFCLPRGNTFRLNTYAPGLEGYREAGTVLQPKKPVDFTQDRLFECTDKFEERCNKSGFDLYPETDDYGEYTVPPDFIKPLLEQL